VGFPKGISGRPGNVKEKGRHKPLALLERERRSSRGEKGGGTIMPADGGEKKVVVLKYPGGKRIQLLGVP